MSPLACPSFPDFCKSCPWSWCVGRLYSMRHGAHGTMSLALPFGCERTYPWVPPESGAVASLCWTAFQKANHLSQPLIPLLMQDFDVTPFCYQLSVPSYILHVLISWALYLKHLCVLNSRKVYVFRNHRIHASHAGRCYQYSAHNLTWHTIKFRHHLLQFFVWMPRIFFSFS